MASFKNPAPSRVPVVEVGRVLVLPGQRQQLRLGEGLAFQQQRFGLAPHEAEVEVVGASMNA
jgi:hypothetical protein